MPPKLMETLNASALAVAALTVALALAYGMALQRYKVVTLPKTHADDSHQFLAIDQWAGTVVLCNAGSGIECYYAGVYSFPK